MSKPIDPRIVEALRKKNQKPDPLLEGIKGFASKFSNFGQPEEVPMSSQFASTDERDAYASATQQAPQQPEPDNAQFEADYDKLAAAKMEPAATDEQLLRSQHGDSVPAALPTPPPASPQPQRAPAVSAQPSAPTPAPAEPYKQPGFAEGDGDGDLRAAQADANSSRLVSGLGRAGDMLASALSGSKRNDAFYDGLDKQAGQGVDDLMQRRKAQSESMDFSNKKALNDPANPQNIAFRESLMKVLPPGAGKNPAFQSITLANPGPFEKIAQFHMAGEARKVAAAATAAQREQTTSQNVDREEKRQGRYDDDRIAKHSDRVEKMGLADLADSLTRADKLIGGINGKNDIPGMGAGAFIPQQILGDQAGSIRQEASNLRDVIMKARSGGAVTASESARMLETLGTGMGKTDAQFRRGLGIIRDILVSKLQNSDAAMSPELLNKYRERGGHTTANDFQSSLTPNQSAPAQPASGRVRVQSPEGKVGSIPESQLQEAIQNGYKQVK